MKTTRFFILTCLMLSTLFFPNAFTQEPPTVQDFPHTLLDNRDRASCYSMAFSPDGTILAAGGKSARRDPSIHLWDVATAQLLDTLVLGPWPTGHSRWSPSDLAFSPDGQILAVGGDKIIRLLDVATGAVLNTLKGAASTYGVTSLEFSPDGTILASAGDAETGQVDVILWDAATGTRRHTLLAGGTYVAFSPDGQILASGGPSKIRLWDVATGELRTTLRHPVWPAVAFSPDGKTLASVSTSSLIGGVDGIYLWDLATGEHLYTIDQFEGVHFGRDVAFSPDGKTLVIKPLITFGFGSNIFLLDVTTGQGLYALRGEFAAFSPDGTILAGVDHVDKPHLGANGYIIRLWNTSTRVSITPLPVASPPIGEQLTVNLSITSGENVGGYQATIGFNPATLRYVESKNGDYLPPGAFFVPPIVNNNRVTVSATTLTTDGGSGDGTLATFTFEVLAVKESQLILHESLVTDPDGTPMINIKTDGQVTLPSTPTTETRTPAFGDINSDGVVNLLDLIRVAASLGQAVPQGGNPADVNQDGVVNVVDLIKVAGALGSTAAAPAVYTQALRTFTASDIQEWIAQAQRLNLMDPTSQRGVWFLEQLLEAFTPKETALLPNYPNPFNPETWIPYHLAETAAVTVSIHTADGKLVRTLALGQQAVGIYQDKTRAAYWDGKTEQGEQVASGVYFYTLSTADFSQSKKMLILK